MLQSTKDMKRRYLFTLEVAPVEVGKTYDDLPSHLTLMSRFFSELAPTQMSESVSPLFGQTDSLQLVFGETTQLGPKKLTVHLVEYTSGLKQLHKKLHDVLDSLNVEYEYPQFVGEGHKPHVTKREGVEFGAGDRRPVHAACLVEVVDEKRVIRARFMLGE